MSAELHHKIKALIAYDCFLAYKVVTSLAQGIPIVVWY